MINYGRGRNPRGLRMIKDESAAHPRRRELVEVWDAPSRHGAEKIKLGGVLNFTQAGENRANPAGGLVRLRLKGSTLKASRTRERLMPPLWTNGVTILFHQRRFWGGERGSP